MRFHGSNTEVNAMHGYALVFSDNVAFSWHPTFEDAVTRQTWETRVMGRNLRVVKDVEATWPEYPHP